MKLFKKPLYLFFVFFFFSQNHFCQTATLEKLVANIISLNTFEKQQDRHIAVNDSFHRANLFKTQFAYIAIMEQACIAHSNKRLEAVVEISRGNFYLGTGNNFNAIESFTRALKIFEDLGKWSGVSTCDANLGNAYFYIRDLDKAEYYYKKAVSDYKKIPDKKGLEPKLANLYNNLGGIYCSKGDFVYGKTYFNLAYNIWAEHKDSISLAYIFNNYANIFFETKHMDSALFYFNKALQIKLKFGDNYDKADAYNNLADYYIKSKKPEVAIANSKKGLQYLDSTIFTRQLVTSYLNLTNGYRVLNDYKNELKYYKLLKLASDSSNNRIQHSAIAQMELKHEFDRMHLADSIKSVEEIKLKDLKISSKNTQSYFLIFILLLTIVALSLIYSRFKLTKKQKLIIEAKNKEITDSINYAKKIQQSILPNEKFFEKEIRRLKDKK